MMRRAFVTALTALTLLIVPTGALAAKQPANLAPYFNDYLVCFSGHVYTDFVDPDGNDEYMNVAMAVYRPHVGDWTYVWMTNTGRTTHGVFWWTKLSDHGIDPRTSPGTRSARPTRTVCGPDGRMPTRAARSSR